MELTSKEQHIFDTIEAIEHERLKDQDAFYIDMLSNIIPPLSQLMIDIEIQSAKDSGCLAIHDAETHDDVCPNFERLFCNNQKNSFLLAKQIMSGLIFSEKALSALIKSVYDFYLYADRDRFRGVYGHEVGNTFSKLKALNELSQIEDLTEEERAQLPELELQTKKRLVNLFYLSMIGDGEVSSWWLVSD